MQHPQVVHERITWRVSRSSNHVGLSKILPALDQLGAQFLVNGAAMRAGAWKLVWAVKRRASEHLWVLRSCSVPESMVSFKSQVAERRIDHRRKAPASASVPMPTYPRWQELFAMEICSTPSWVSQRLSHRRADPLSSQCNSVSDGKQEQLARCINDATCVRQRWVIFTGCKWCRSTTGRLT